MKTIEYLLLSIVLLSITIAQNPSVITIGGSGTAVTSAHINVTDTGGNKAYLCPDECIIEDGASFSTWGPEAICSAIIADRVISGFIKDVNTNGVEHATVTFNNGGPTVMSDGTGFYSASVAFGWSGTAVPSGGGYNYTPVNYSYTNVTADIANQDYVAATKYVKVSGIVTWSSTTNPIEGITVTFSNGGPTVTTDVNGYYEVYLLKPYSGTAAPFGGGCDFAPSSKTYTNISAKEENQDYAASPQFAKISGFVKDVNTLPIEGVDVAFNNGGKTVITDVSGYYEIYVNWGWSGTSTPSKAGYNCEPISYSYTTISTKQENQDYTGTEIALGLEDYISSLPEEFTILPAFPNPFNPSTTLRYGLDKDSHVTIEIYDISGKLISTLLNEEQSLGWYTLVWNCTNQQGTQVPAGLYLSRIISGNDVRTNKLMFLK